MNKVIILLTAVLLSTNVQAQDVLTYSYTGGEVVLTDIKPLKNKQFEYQRTQTSAFDEMNTIRVIDCKKQRIQIVKGSDWERIQPGRTSPAYEYDLICNGE